MPEVCSGGQEEWAALVRELSKAPLELFPDVGELAMAKALLERRTDDALGKGGALERGQSEISDFDRA